MLQQSVSRSSEFALLCARSGAPLTNSTSFCRSSSTDTRQGKNFADLDKHELESEAKDNYKRPLGAFVGDGQLKGLEAGEEGVSPS